MNSNRKIKLIFKAFYFIGNAIAFLGVFFDFYSISTVIFGSQTLSSWSYNLFSGWSSDTQYQIIMLIPNVINLSFYFHLFFLAMLLSSIFCIIFKSLESSKKLSDLVFYSYLHIFILLLIGFYILIFPLYYLLPNQLYFPFAIIHEPFLGIERYYSFGIGYYLECISFISIFPYTVFYMQTVRNFEFKNEEVQKLADKIMEANVNLDLDKLIAEEQLKVNFQHEQIPNISQKWRKR
ncbi:MAG: membrane protein of unknown function [Promethearchaeota archaeon]|nr:MAG: membrane protein of unknown function [Candidatus Lokiarchaeota archaeon]